LFDLDGDQAIQRNEFQKGLKDLSVKLSKRVINRIFDDIDKDGDGKLNYQEFSAFILRYKDAKTKYINPINWIVVVALIQSNL